MPRFLTSRNYKILRIDFTGILETRLGQSRTPRDIELGQKTNAVKATLRRALVVLVGAFPPPLHGMAAVNAAVRKARADRPEELIIARRAAVQSICPPWPANMLVIDPNFPNHVSASFDRVPRY
jgi:hypothetical protein